MISLVYRSMLSQTGTAMSNISAGYKVHSALIVFIGVYIMDSLFSYKDTVMLQSFRLLTFFLFFIFIFWNDSNMKTVELNLHVDAETKTLYTCVCISLLFKIDFINETFLFTRFPIEIWHQTSSLIL